MATLIIVLVLSLLGVILNMFAYSFYYNGLGLANDIWNTGMQAIYNVLTRSMDSSATAMGADFSTVINIANGIMITVATVICSCLALAEMGKTMTTMLETKRIENWVKGMLRISLAWWTVNNIQPLLTAVYNQTFLILAQSGDVAGSDPSTLGQLTGERQLVCLVGQSTAFARDISGSLASGLGSPTVWTAFTALGDGNDSVASVVATCLPGALTLLCVICAGLTIITIFSTLTEFLITFGSKIVRIFLHVALAPLAISTFASSGTSFIGKQFVKSFFGLSIETVIGVLILRIWPGFCTFLVRDVWMASFTTGELKFDLSGDDVKLMIVGAIGLISAFGVLKQFMKSIDQVISQMLGLGGA